MITDPTTLLALALCVGTLGLVVLILPLLILFWSQMEPQLIGLVGAGGDEEDEYPSHSVLPRLMKSFGHMAEIEREREAKKPARKAPAKSSSRKAAPTSRSKATTSSKSVKAAPAKTKKPAIKAATKATKATKAKATNASTKKTAKATKRPAAKSAKPKPAARRTPAGAERDPILGIVYSKKPKEIDDLKEIKGVAKVIEAKLHKVGVYTFRQIVEWDDAAIDAFSEKLSFKGRIRNEDWQTQCAKFHKDKYDQKIG